jgi:hypothetical protein
MCRARGAEVGLTDVVAQPGGGGAEQRHLQLAPGAAGEDERGEGGSKSENGSGWVDLTVWRGGKR